jgi:adenine-specific DNA methylase
LKTLPNNSVDAVITDPPFSDEIQYFELSFMAASWLGLTLPFEKEIIVNPKQGKSQNDYHRQLAQAFRELNRVLKNNHSGVFMLHDEDPEMLSTLVEIVKGSGFRVRRRATAQMPRRMVGNRDDENGKDLLIIVCNKE